MNLFKRLKTQFLFLTVLVFGIFATSALAEIPKEISFSNENPKPPVLTGIKNPVASKKINAFIQKEAVESKCDGGGEYEISFEKKYADQKILSFKQFFMHSCDSMPGVSSGYFAYNFDLTTGEQIPLSRWLKKEQVAKLKLAAIQKIKPADEKSEQWTECFSQIDDIAQGRYVPSHGEEQVYLISPKKEILFLLMYTNMFAQKSCTRFVNSGYFIE